MAVFNQLKAIDQERITVDSTVGGVSLTASKWIDPPLAMTAQIKVESATMRYLTDGTAPTSTTGTIAYPGDTITLNNPSELQNFKAIRTGSSSAAIQVIYFGN